MSAAGALLGLACAVGLLAIAGRLQAFRRVTTLARIAPELAAREQARGPVSTLTAILRRPASPERDSDLSTRLARAGSRQSPAQFRAEQATWAVAGAAIGGAAGLLLAVGGSSWAGPVLLALAGGACGFVGCDRRLTARVRSRQERIDRQLPAAVELMAFAVSAGESPASAMQRVGRTMQGDLAAEMAHAGARQQSGDSFESALAGLARATGTASVRRAVDALSLSLERGTPIAEVLRAQAADARADQRRALMEKAGRKDVLMLLPIVFLILPIVVVIAVYPGFTGLQLLVP